MVVGSNLINQKNLDLLEDKEVLLVMDENIPSKYKDLISDELLNISSNFQSLEIFASEESKNGKTLDKIHSKLIDARYSRDCVMVGFGGGITCEKVCEELFLPKLFFAQSSDHFSSIISGSYLLSI